MMTRCVEYEKYSFSVGNITVDSFKFVCQFNLLVCYSRMSIRFYKNVKTKIYLRRILVHLNIHQQHKMADVHFLKSDCLYSLWT